MVKAVAAAHVVRRRWGTIFLKKSFAFISLFIIMTFQGLSNRPEVFQMVGGVKSPFSNAALSIINT